MINLPEVTLFSIDTTSDIEGTIKAVHTSMNGVNYGAIKLVTTKENIEKYRDELEPDGITLEEPVMEVKNYNHYNYFVIHKLHEHIDTSHCLLVQPDGFVLFPEKWENSWLDYDYIGAPWPWREQGFVTPFGEHIAVGNGGFSLRSKKLTEVPTKVDVPFDVVAMNDFYKMFGGVNWNEDGNICVHNRHIFEEQGCKFAPVEVAKDFSHESPLDINRGIIPFGYHGNLPSGVEIFS